MVVVLGPGWLIALPTYERLILLNLLKVSTENNIVGGKAVWPLLKTDRYLTLKIPLKRLSTDAK